MELDTTDRMDLNKHEAFQVVLNPDVSFEQPHPEIHVARIPIANATWIETTDGIVLIDTLLTPASAKQIKSRMASSGGELRKIIYTHHHFDHIGGSIVFTDDNPEVIAHRYLPDNLESYQRLKKHRARIASIQFNVPFDLNRRENYLPPTRLFDHSLVFQQGDKTFELFHARAETDDATWIWIPEVKTAVVGDLIIAGLPNIGNPFKPTRFAMPWARALEQIRDKKPELLIAHGGRAVYQGKDIHELLDVTIEAIHSLLDQVFDLINEDVPLNEMIHAVKLPPHLQDHKYLKPVYSRTEFAVYNIYRWYHGYFDHNPANLLPRPDKEINSEIVALIEDRGKILQRAIELRESGNHQLALQVLDILLKEDPGLPGARKLHLEILETLCQADTCLMSRNSWVYFIEKDRELLNEKT